jgi:hypothetical protein
MQSGSFNKLSGEIEADETFIGGKARNMHVGKRQRRITGTGTKDKTAVMGILERGGKVEGGIRTHGRVAPSAIFENVRVDFTCSLVVVYRVVL